MSQYTQADLVKDGGHHYFISSLDVNEPGMSPDSRAQAAFVLAVICDSHKRGRLVCAEQGLLQKLLSLLSSMVRGAPGTVNGLHQCLQVWQSCLNRMTPPTPLRGPDLHHGMLQQASQMTLGLHHWCWFKHVLLHLSSIALPAQAGGATSQAVHGASSSSSPPLLVKWLCLCLGRLVEDQPELLSQACPSAHEPFLEESTSMSAMTCG